MKREYSIALTSLAKDFDLEPIFLPDNIADIRITRSDVSRPGLPLAGFFDAFVKERIQLIGNMEHSYLSSLTPEQRASSLDTFFSHNVVCALVTSGLDIFDEMLDAAKKYGTPLYRTQIHTSDISATLISALNVSLAERITTHGVLVEVYGEGVLMLGDSGIGKSETAIELVKRGHRLIADDAVEIKRVSSRTLVGNAPEMIRYYIELRGIGVVDVRRIFGMGSVKDTEKIDLVINFENWEQGKAYERLGNTDMTTEILGITVPSITVPVKPGRNLAVIIEIAAMNNRQKKMGYNTAEELDKRIAEFYGTDE